MIDRFRIENQQSPENFIRTTGMSLENFYLVLEKIKINILEQLEAKPMKKRGLKANITLENKLLLTLLYLRNYPTFFILGKSFGISESYANKTYHYILNILVKIIHVQSHKMMMNKDLDTVIIDVTEQQIERPVKGQKQYYSGKKKTHD
jgi:hypothetical protein